MKLPKLTFYLFTYVFLFRPVSLDAQSDSAKKWLRFSIDAEIIVNRSFSNYTKPSYGSRFSSESITMTKGAPKYLPGFSLGFTSILGKANSGYFIFGISASFTQARYNLSQSSYYPGEGYSSKSESTNLDISSQFINLNYEVGYRFKIFKRFLLQQTFFVNQNVQTIQKENGTKTSVESSYYTTSAGGWFPIYYYRTDEAIHRTENFHDGSNLSIRVKAFYQFRIKKKESLIFVYRNFTVNDKLPWWGFGFSVVL